MFTLSQLCAKVASQENFEEFVCSTKQLVFEIDSLDDKDFIEFSHLQKSLLNAYFAIAKQEPNLETWTKAMEKGEQLVARFSKPQVLNPQARWFLIDLAKIIHERQKFAKEF